MRRTTISVPDEVGEALEREARRRGVSVSSVAREALAAHLGLGNGHGRRELPFASVGRSGHRTTARDLEEILAAEWDPGARRR